MIYFSRPSRKMAKKQISIDLPQIEDITVNNSKHKNNLVNKVGDW